MGRNQGLTNLLGMILTLNLTTIVLGLRQSYFERGVSTLTAPSTYSNPWVELNKPQTLLTYT